MTAVESCDVCIVGAGLAGLNALFVASRYLSREQKVILIDRRQRVGGMWVDTYPYVRLHQPHPMFTAGNIEWTLGKHRSYLATKGEVLDHFEHCLRVIKQRVRVDEYFGWAMESDEETDGDVRITCRSSDGQPLVVEAKRLIKAYGFRIEPNDPLEVSSTRVQSVSPDFCDMRGGEMRASDTPVWIIGGGQDLRTKCRAAGPYTLITLVQYNLSLISDTVPGKVFAHIDMQLPPNWGVSVSGNSAVVGILAGGTCDIPLRLEIYYEKGAEGLAPTCCPHHPPVEVTGVRTVESGFRPVGDKTAEFRRFTATCAEQTIERRGWLLPESKVAIVEQQPSPENDAVVQQMRVGALKDVVFENVTFHVPQTWNIAVDGATAVLAKLPRGERDSQLTLTKNFTKPIDDLAPKADCDGGEVAVIESGLRQLDGATADYREYVVRCPTGQVDAHRAWVLPDSNIAIFEDHQSPDVDEVEHIVANATVR